MWIISCIVLVLLHIGCSNCRLWRRTSEPLVPCETASDALQQIIQSGDDWLDMFFEGTGGIAPILIQRITGYTPDKFPQDFICQFQDITTQCQLLDTLHHYGYLQNLFRVTYNYATVMFAIKHYKYVKEGNRKKTQLEIMKLVKLSGLLDQDPEGNTIISSFAPVFYTENWDLQPGDMIHDEDDIYEVAYQLSNKIIELWRLDQPLHPDPDHLLREQLEEYIGIKLMGNIEAHLNVMLVGMIEASVEDGFDGIYQYLYQHDVFHMLTKTYYPVVQKSLMRIDGIMAGLIDDPNQGAVYATWHQLLSNLIKMSIFKAGEKC